MTTPCSCPFPAVPPARAMKRGSSFVKARSLIIVTLALASTACGGRKEFQDGGVYTRRTVCPQVAIPAATGDVTMFDPAGRTDAAAIDVVATMTNVRSTCSEGADAIVSSATFDVVAVRRTAGEARSVVIPYFDIAMQAGSQVVAKRVGGVAVNFPPGAFVEVAAAGRKSAFRARPPRCPPASARNSPRSARQAT